MDVADECEAFLAGRYVEALEAVGADVPPGAWLNVVAHGTLRRVLRDACGDVPAAGDPPSSWPQASAVIARMVLSVASTPASLRALQEERLVPLELALLAGPGPSRPVELVERVRWDVVVPARQGRMAS